MMDGETEGKEMEESTDSRSPLNLSLLPCPLLFSNPEPRPSPRIMRRLSGVVSINKCGWNKSINEYDFNGINGSNFNGSSDG